MAADAVFAELFRVAAAGSTLGAIDSHVHVWDSRRFPLSWFSEAGHLPEANLPACAGWADDTQRISGEVWVQAGESAQECAWLLAEADVRALPTWVVGHVDLTGGMTMQDRASADSATAARVRELQSQPGGSRLVGVRASVREDDPLSLVTPVAQRAVAEVAEQGLTLDLLLGPDHLTAAAEIARRNPAVTFVVDHLALPEPDEWNLRAKDTWLAGMRGLAQCENVFVKLSGFLAWCAEAACGAVLMSCVEAVFKAFGSHRVMFGSDWPMPSADYNYAEVFQATSQLLLALGVAESSTIWRLAAARAYGLDRWHHQMPDQGLS